MDIKLTYMVKKILYIIILLITCSCSTNKNKMRYNKFDEKFKEYSFCLCTFYGYSDVNKNLAKQMNTIDKSNSRFMYAIIEERSLEFLLNKERNKMKKDSLISIKTTSEASAGKKILTNCLNFYKSKSLDSLSKIQYKRFKNIKNIDSLIQTKLPDY